MDMRRVLAPCLFVCAGQCWCLSRHRPPRCDLWRGLSRYQEGKTFTRRHRHTTLVQWNLFGSQNSPCGGSCCVAAVLQQQGVCKRCAGSWAQYLKLCIMELDVGDTSGLRGAGGLAKRPRLSGGDRVAALPSGSNFIEVGGKTCTHEVAWPPGAGAAPCTCVPNSHADATCMASKQGVSAPSCPSCLALSSWA